LVGKEAVHRALVRQVQFGPVPRDQVAVAIGPQPPHQRGAHHAVVACDKEDGVLVHGAYSWCSSAWKPASVTSASRRAIWKSERTISLTSLENGVRGAQPSLACALDGSPSSVSTSVGRKYAGSTRTITLPGVSLV